jgi:hypothetical protein
VRIRREGSTPESFAFKVESLQELMREKAARKAAGGGG